ncbi:protein kinase domain-containing protein [Calycomorphotria hydatis]|uniref:Serine/threonine-protein kinase PrkC n=1 Tax=Calycomorphotria hydatis TaxID=2528027 RepID=A0A517T978_9PLAN|nr:protein kinase [Calycomorphotria hydatis]QDT64926.1 Serine/threonine-protein kinase PrkC [Calycomorphotria hydatis]
MSADPDDLPLVPTRRNEGSTAQAGRRVANYLLKNEIGRGGTAVVYSAYHESLGRDVALKLMPEKGMGNERAIERFRREMQAVGRLNHPNVVQAIDAGRANGYYYLAMELIDGVDLQSIIDHRSTGSDFT